MVEGDLVGPERRQAIHVEAQHAAQVFRGGGGQRDGAGQDQTIGHA